MKPIFPFLIAAIISMNGLSIHMQVFVIAKAVQYTDDTLRAGQTLECHSCAFHSLFDHVGTKAQSAGA